MKPNELRIGNWFSNPIGDEHQITYHEIRILVIASVKPNYKPIPLTPEWLEKFGFEKLNGFYYFGFVNLRKNIIRDGSGNYDGFYLDNYPKAKPFQYVHQLQNLYFALTGNELEIKELNEND